jgi:hypothetical protein
MRGLRVNAPNLKACPPAGEGNHAWLFYAACTLVDAGFSNEDATPILGDGMTRDPTPHSEIDDALKAARREEREPTSKWPLRNQRLVELLLSKDEVAIEPTDLGTLDALRLLFPGNPLLCIGQSSSSFATKHLNEFKFIDKNALIVPSPMSAKQGKTKEGHLSAHSLENTGPRRYLVCEADWGLINGQLKLIQHLSTHGRLVMVVHSGSKSAHSWFDVRGISEDDNLRFFEYAVQCGMDPRTWSRSQFVRLPGGWREDKGKKQQVLYIDADYLGQAKFAKPLGQKDL